MRIRVDRMTIMLVLSMIKLSKVAAFSPAVDPAKMLRTAHPIAIRRKRARTKLTMLIMARIIRMMLILIYSYKNATARNKRISSVILKRRKRMT